MSRLYGFAIAAVLGVFICAQTSQACRYNVRDVGFVNLIGDPYFLFVYVDKDTSDEKVAEFEKSIAQAVLDTNLYGEILHIEKDKAHPAMELIEKHKITSYPAVVLGTSEGRSRTIDIPEPEESFDKKLTAAVEDIVTSPKRQEILKHVAKSYGVVLLIEGKDKDENALARTAAENAVEMIKSHMDFLPKPIEQPPTLVVMEQAELAAEQMFLWSMELEAAKITSPHVIVLYGRMRRLGPALAGNDLTEDIVTNILSIIGADCECGLDRKWMEGMMMPAKWDTALQTQLVKSLGFDPENPMVKMEISRILRKGPATGGGFGNMAAMGGTPFGYQEIIVEFDDEDANSPDINDEITKTEGIEVEKAEPVVVAVKPVENMPIEEPPTEEVTSDVSFKMTVIAAVGICGVVILIGLGILIRARR